MRLFSSIWPNVGGGGIGLKVFLGGTPLLKNSSDLCRSQGSAMGVWPKIFSKKLKKNFYFFKKKFKKKFFGGYPKFFSEKLL